MTIMETFNGSNFSISFASLGAIYDYSSNPAGSAKPSISVRS